MSKSKYEKAAEKAAEYINDGYTRDQVIRFLMDDFRITKYKAEEIYDEVLRDLRRFDYAVDPGLQLRRR